MNEKYSALFTPWKIGNVEIKNRIVQPSMGGTSLFGWLEPCHFDKEAAYHILNRAQNNVGLVLPGMQCVRDTMGGRWLYQNKKMFKDLAEWLPEFHKTGSKLFVQLSAGMGRSMAINEIMVKMLQNKAFGAVGKPFLNVDYITASASATPNRWYPECKSRPLTVEEIHEMVDAFAKTAKLLQDAGVDGVEIHAVHEGYLLDQFTIANMNYRTDEYGGSFENRYRFAVEIVQAIKAVCGKDFPVALRYSVVSKTKGFGQGAVPGEEFVEFGRDMAESEKAIKYLEDAGYDMFDCDNGTYDAWYWAHPPVYMPENCNLSEVEHIKNFTSKPVVCAGKMDPAKAAEEIAAGRLDAVGIARQNLVDPVGQQDPGGPGGGHQALHQLSQRLLQLQQVQEHAQYAAHGRLPAPGPLRPDAQHHAAQQVQDRSHPQAQEGRHYRRRHRRYGVRPGAQAARPHPRHLRKDRRAGRPVHHRLRHELQGGRQGPAALVRA